MSATAILSSILTLIAGIGIFLIACEMMSHNLESASSKKLKTLFSKAAKSRWLGVGIGTVGTAAIQSSGATTVMVIGFVNAGIMSLSQAATVIYGANIGTTITAQIVALGMFGSNMISTTVLFSAFAGIGAFVSLFSKKPAINQLGGIITGFGMLFVGLNLMSSSMECFAALDSVKVMLSHISNPILLVVLGTLLTAVIQSSSVMTSIAIAMVYTGLISLDQGIFLTMGSNIGSCVVAIIAGMTSGVNAKRTSLIHLLFNVGGVVLFMILGVAVTAAGGRSFGEMLERMFPGAPSTQLAMFHTIFNCTTVVIMMPLTGFLVRTVTGLVKDEDVQSDNENLNFKYIDTNLLKTPPLAVAQTKKEIMDMADLAIKNFNRSIDLAISLDFSQMELFKNAEKRLDYLNVAISKFVVDLSSKPQLNDYDRIYLASSYRTVHDLERIGDYAENITEYADSMRQAEQSFSSAAAGEIEHVRNLINDLFVQVKEAYHHASLDALAKANEIEDSIDDYTALMGDNHIERLSEDQCTAIAGSNYLSLSTSVERIADHLINVAKTIRNLPR